MKTTLYHITNICPRTDIAMGRCGFTIHLFESWREAVKVSQLDQEKVDLLIHNMHRQWLDGCGFEKTVKRGPEYPVYSEHSIRVTWGEWGPEHITVPGDACGLDLDRGLFSRESRRLSPHNVDRLNQVVLLLVVFTTIADCVIYAL